MRRLPLKISLSDLRRWHACQGQRVLFRRTFGWWRAWRGVPVTETNLLQAAGSGLRIGWLLVKLLPGCVDGIYEETFHALGGRRASCRFSSIVRDCVAVSIVAERGLLP